jgi:hypothetical protein
MAASVSKVNAHKANVIREQNVITIQADNVIIDMRQGIHHSNHIHSKQLPKHRLKVSPPLNR